ncbi:MAG: DUF2330 domain-containing protein, partial [Candidatus Altiarchaeales archaeon]|nr:DUF2330 domain-containing protein [Candidatus Altiarchaeales archaeon]
MKKTVLTLLFALILFTQADGGFFPPLGYSEDLYEPQQKAVLIHDGETETLILQASYKHELTDFAWVIPTPGYPEINKTSAKLFQQLHYLTEPLYADGIEFSAGLGGVADSTATKDQVTVHEQRQVGLYEVSILSAEDAGALIGWLNQNKYKISPEAEEAINYYVEKKWFFTACRINLNPDEEKLLKSLRKIDENITTSKEAVEKLTQYLVEKTKANQTYTQLRKIRTAKLDYGEVDEELENPYYYYNRHSRSSKPEVLISEEKYTQIFENYNGYLPKHMRQQIKSAVELALTQKTRIRSEYQCNWADEVNSQYCGLWRFTKNDEAYQVIEETCRKNCETLKVGSSFSMDELAETASHAAQKGEEKILAYFNLRKDKPHWHYNAEDMRQHYERQIRSKLSAQAYERRSAKESELLWKLVEDYEKMLEKELHSITQTTTHLTELVYADLQDGKHYAKSRANKYQILDSTTYLKLQRKHEGDSDEVGLRNQLKEAVEATVYWRARLTQTRLGEGTIQPITLTFPSHEIIYPLRISAINKGVTEILLYVFSQHKTQVEGFDVEYAKWIEVEDVEDYIEIQEILDDRYYLTKHRASMWPKQMTQDLVITKAPNNTPYVKKVKQKMALVEVAYMILSFTILYSLTCIVNLAAYKL